MPKPEYEVKDGEVHEVSLVGTPANGREFAMFKSVNEIKQLEKALEKAVHNPEYMEKDERDWNSPDLEDFKTNDLSEISEHFIASVSDFPPENFTDLKLPVVEPDGTLNKNAVDNAAARVSQTEGIDTDEAESIINNLQEEFESEEMSKDSTEENEDQTNSDETETEKGGSESTVETEEIVEALKELDDEEREDIVSEFTDKETDEEVEEEETEKDLDELPDWAKEEIKKSSERDEKLEELRKERELDELEKSVEEDYNFLPGNSRENAEILKSVKDSSQEAYDELVSKLDALNEQIDTSELFKEAGTQDVEPSTDVLEKVNELAEEKVENGEFDEMAKAKTHIVTEEKPELYAEYRKQKQNQ